MTTCIRAAAFAATALLAAACGGSGSSDPDVSVPNVKPDFIKGAIISTTYDGNSDDLLTAGLGKTGLAGASPTAAVPTSPTAAELRRIAIWNNYRALVDIAAAGGYGTLYGPNVDANGTVTTSEGKIAGEEHIAYADDGTGKQNVTMMVQIPSTFRPDDACIITATSSGSRGVYGAIATAGEWGLKHGCAVAYTDKGSGNGAHDLNANAVNLIQGQRINAGTAGTSSQFTANVSATDLAAFNSAFPNRWAYKHAHSQQNPEKDWGRDTLRAVQFAFYMLNEKFGTANGSQKLQTITRDKTIVIASSVSNGAAGALGAAEQDTGGLIDGVAVGEPAINVNAPANLTIKRGDKTVPSFAHPLLDYFTIASLYEPCASLAPAAAGAPGAAFVPAALAANRCASLAAKGLVAGDNPTVQANASLQKLLDTGWELDSIPFQPSHYALAVPAVAVTYANAFTQSSVKDNLCGYSFGGAPVAGVPAPISATAAAQIFGTGNGVPPTSGINILNNNSVGGTAVDAASVTPSTGIADFNIDGAICLRNLWTGSDALAVKARANVEATKRTGNLHGLPAIIVHGRSDTLVPVNNTSRPYYALNKTVDSASQLSYIEVQNAQHFDAFIDNAALPGYDSRLVPLHRYVNQALDMMYAHLKTGAALPASQVVRTTPRGGTPGAAPAITAANVPPIALVPTPANQITFSNNTLTIPE